MKSNKINETSGETGLGNFVRFWHLAMVGLVFAAWLTGDLARDYKKIEHTGFLIHGRIGMALALAVFLYLVYGIFGPRSARFSEWFPFTGKRLQQTKADLTELTQRKLPEHKRRQGLAGLVQFLGILLFFWLATTGSLMYFLIDPGSKVKGVLHAVKEAHEIGGVLIPIYLSIHIGAVIAHAFTGNHVWKEIFFFKK